MFIRNKSFMFFCILYRASAKWKSPDSEYHRIQYQYVNRHGISSTYSWDFLQTMHRNNETKSLSLVNSADMKEQI